MCFLVFRTLSHYRQPLMRFGLRSQGLLSRGALVPKTTTLTIRGAPVRGASPLLLQGMAAAASPRFFSFRSFFFKNSGSNKKSGSSFDGASLHGSNVPPEDGDTSDRKPILVQLVPESRFMQLLKLVPTILILSLFVYVTIKIVFGDERKPISFPISNAHQEIDVMDVRFEDVKGLEEVKEELKEVIEYLKNPEKFKRLGARLPKGVLLVGPPGTGKTLLARAVAGEAGVRFLYCTGSSFDELFVGVGPKRIRALFEDAKKSPNGCIIFIDEIDTIGVSRQYSYQHSSSKESTLNQLLTELDGFKQTEGIIVMAATNFPDSLDPALVRPGRFDKQIHIWPPDILERKQILEYYLSKTKYHTDVDVGVLARGTPGFTGADLSNLVNLAAIKATTSNLDFIHMKNLEEAKDDVLMGIQKKGGYKDAQELKTTAYHEGGHALVALYTKGAHPLHKATIIPRGAAAGVTMMLPEKDEYSVSKQQAMARLAVAYGGRIAEELIFGADNISSGAINDYQNATALAYKMVAKWGMVPEVGNVSYTDLKNLSENERKLIDEEVKKLLQKAYDNARATLVSHQSELHRLATALLERETLTGEEIKMVVEGKTLPKIL